MNKKNKNKNSVQVQEAKLRTIVVQAINDTFGILDTKLRKGRVVFGFECSKHCTTLFALIFNSTIFDFREIKNRKKKTLFKPKTLFV